MATVKKAAAVIIVFFIARTFIACCDCGGTGLEDLGYYGLQNLSVAALDNSGRVFFVSTDPIKKEAFGLALYFELIEATSYSPQQIFSSAYAGRYTPRDTIESIRILTLDNFNADHPAGSDIKDLFKAKYGAGGSYFPIEQYYEPDYSYSLNEVLYVFLLTPPATTDTYNFRVEVELTDGRILTAEHEAQLY